MSPYCARTGELLWCCQYIYNSMDNQFINASLLVSKSGQYTDHKDELIKKLQTKNNKLKSELIKIQRTIQEKFGQIEEESGPKKRQSIFQHQDNYEVLTKELSNTYKRIKMYEYEVNKLEDPTKSINITQKSSQFQLILKQKKVLAQKLKIKLIKEQKVSQDNIRKLEKNSQKDQLQAVMRKLTDEANFFKGQLKSLQEKEQIKAGNMRKQYEAIKRLQNQLLESGLAGGELEQLKRNAINNVRVSPTRRTMQETKRHKEEALMSGSQEEIEDRTREHYGAFLAEVALLQKMQNDHQKQMVRSFDDKVESINKNMESRNRLLQCQNQIENLEKEIQIIKGKVLPSNLKPTKPLRSFSSHQGQNTAKLMPTKYINPLRTKASRQLNNHSHTQRLHQQ